MGWGWASSAVATNLGRTRPNCIYSEPDSHAESDWGGVRRPPLYAEEEGPPPHRPTTQSIPDSPLIHRATRIEISGIHVRGLLAAMAAPSAPRLRPADVPAGEMVQIAALQISSKVNVPVDREIPYGGLVPASSKAAAAGRTGPVKGCSAPDGQGRAKGRSTAGGARKKAEREKPSGAVVKAGCIEKPSGEVVKSGCIEKPSGAVVKSGCIEKSSGEKPSGADVTRDGVLTPVGNGLWQLPDDEVQWVLSRRREDVPSDLFGLDCVESVNAVRDEFFEYQAWLRAEYDANDGCVFVDDKFVAEREEHEQWMSTWSVPMTDRLDLGDLDFSDRLSDFYEEDSEDEVEVQELDTN